MGRYQYSSWTPTARYRGRDITQMGTKSRRSMYVCVCVCVKEVASLEPPYRRLAPIVLQKPEEPS